MLTRSTKNPILRPNDNHAWESKKVYNPAAIEEKGEYHLFYRAIGADWTSTIGYAYSFDGEKFIRFDKPLLEPFGKYETNGIEDPRITKIEGCYYLTYTAYDGLTARLCLATSRDLKKWTKKGPMLPNWNAEKAKALNIVWDSARNNQVAKKKWNKAGAIFPEKIKDKF
jgi:beta-1,2-mannosidase